MANKAMHRVLLAIVFLAASCQTDLVVSDQFVVWDPVRREVKATIANQGSQDAGPFVVYINGDEDPVSPNHRPQVTYNVPGLSARQSVSLPIADFAPLAHRDNQFLANVYRITVQVDPKQQVTESDETNNTRQWDLRQALLISHADGFLALDPQTGEHRVLFASSDPAQWLYLGDSRPCHVWLAASRGTPPWIPGAVRRFDLQAGTFTTVSQGGLLGPGGVLGSPHAVELELQGQLLVATTTIPKRILRIDPQTGGQSVVSEGGLLGQIYGMTLRGDGQLFAASWGGGVGRHVVRIDTASGQQTLVWSAGSLEPRAIAIERSGQLLVGGGAPIGADSKIHRIDPATGQEQILSQGGALRIVHGIVVFNDGSIYVASVFSDNAGWHASIVRIDPVTGAQTVILHGNPLSHIRGMTSVPHQCIAW